MLLDESTYSLCQASDVVLPGLSRALDGRVSPETHAAVLEIKTGVHRDPVGAGAELAAMRRRLALDLRRLGVVAACAGMHPLARPEDTEISSAARYRAVADSMRSLAHASQPWRSTCTWACRIRRMRSECSTVCGPACRS